MKIGIQQEGALTQSRSFTQNRLTASIMSVGKGSIAD